MIQHFLYEILIKHVFCVNSLLGFRRAIPTTGRTLNIIKQMMLIGPESLKETLFKSPEPYNNHCFYGKCRLYCDRHHSICGNGDQLEVCLVSKSKKSINLIKRFIKELFLKK